MKRIAINGLGRVGRLLLRRYHQSAFKNFEIVAVNDPMPVDNLIYLLKYDSVHGKPSYQVAVKGDQLLLDDWTVSLFSQTDPVNLPWQALTIDLVIDCSGHFRHRAEAMQHIDSGAERVLIGAPSPDADITLVQGVNEQQYDPSLHQIISNASCTTNSLAPPLKVMDQQFGIERVLITTVHAYTVSQNIVDSAAKRKHRGRAGAINIIPTSTGADAATAQVLPQLKDRISALALRVPVVNGALTDISAELRSPVSVEMLNTAFKNAANGSLKGILEYSDEELVSSDIIGNPHSAIIHGRSTRVVKNNYVKVQVWYDNEYGYACRCLELIERICSL